MENKKNDEISSEIENGFANPKVNEEGFQAKHKAKEKFLITKVFFLVRT